MVISIKLTKPITLCSPLFVFFIPFSFIENVKWLRNGVKMGKSQEVGRLLSEFRSVGWPGAGRYAACLVSLYQFLCRCDLNRLLRAGGTKARVFLAIPTGKDRGCPSRQGPHTLETLFLPGGNTHIGKSSAGFLVQGLIHQSHWRILVYLSHKRTLWEDMKITHGGETDPSKYNGGTHISGYLLHFSCKKSFQCL